MASLKEKLVSMKTKAVDNTPKESVPCCPEDDYPYGLRISLNESSLQKLGLSVSDFEVDGTVKLTAVCDVTELRSSKGNHYSSENVELQITKLAIKED